MAARHGGGGGVEHARCTDASSNGLFCRANRSKCRCALTSNAALLLESLLYSATKSRVADTSLAEGRRRSGERKTTRCVWDRYTCRRALRPASTSRRRRAPRTARRAAPCRRAWRRRLRRRRFRARRESPRRWSSLREREARAISTVQRTDGSRQVTLGTRRSKWDVWWDCFTSWRRPWLRGVPSWLRASSASCAQRRRA